MFEINKMIVKLDLVDGEIVEKDNYALFGNILIKIDRLEVCKDMESIDENDEFYNIYENHITNALAQEMEKYLHDIMKLSKDSKHDIQYILSKRNRCDEENELVVQKRLAIEYATKEKLKNSMNTLDNLAYFKAQKLYFEGKIDAEISKRENNNS